MSMGSTGADICALPCECALDDWECVVAVLWIDARSDERDGGGGAARRGTYGVAMMMLLDEDAADTVGRMIGELGDEPEPEFMRATGYAGGGGDFTVVGLAELGRSGSLGGTDLRGTGARSHARLMRRSVLGLAREDADTSSYDSDRLTESESPALRAGGGELCSASMGKVAMWLVTEPGVLGS